MKSSYASVAVFFVSLVAFPVLAQFIEAPTPPPPSLKELALPTVIERNSGLPLVDDGGGGFIKDEQAAIVLGKALFWDTQVGSTGVACATCHYHAGADNRSINQLSPGIKGGNGTFDITNTGGGGPNYGLTEEDYPFHKLDNPTDRDSMVINSIDDVTSSQGVHAAIFNDIEIDERIDDCTNIPDAFGFTVDGLNVRRVEPRNTPTVINAVFNHRNFWDGRANNIFNGVDNRGLRNTDARILENQEGTLTPVAVAFENSSLASQAVVPVVSDFEMSCTGRTMRKVGQKMLSLKALHTQRISPTDSVLGGFVHGNHPGMKDANGDRVFYVDLVKAAFVDRLWDSNELVDGGQFTHMEANFALFWGLAIMAYERTLVADDTPFDQWSEANAAGPQQAMPITDGLGELTADEVAGMNLFFENKVGERGLCSTCHQGPTFTTAAFPFSEEAESGEFPEREQLVERMKMGDGVTITENLFRFSVSGEGSIPGYSMSGTAGSWNLPDTYPATVGGDLSVNDCQRRVHSYLTSPIPSFIAIPSFIGPPVRDAVVIVQAADQEGCDDWLEITIIDGGPEMDTATVRPINPIVKRLPQTPGMPIPSYIGPDVTGPVVGDFTLNGPTLYDTAFYNIGVRPTADDPGVGANDGDGIPLSFTRQWVQSLLGEPILDDLPLQLSRLHLPFNWYGDGVFYPGGLTGPEWPVIDLVFFQPFPDPNCVPDPVAICQVGIEEGKGHGAYPKPPSKLGQPIASYQYQAISDMPTAVDGAFKTAGLRNAELTGPYFHNGGHLTLDQVVDFYNRGGDFALENVGNLSPNIHPLGLDETQRGNIVAFLKALTDDRVRCEQAPFDHPEITIPEGARLKNNGSVVDNKDGTAKDDFTEIPAVGAGGRPAENLACLQGFLQ